MLQTMQPLQATPHMLGDQPTIGIGGQLLSFTQPVTSEYLRLRLGREGEGLDGWVRKRRFANHTAATGRAAPVRRPTNYWQWRPVVDLHTTSNR